MFYCCECHRRQTAIVCMKPQRSEPNHTSNVFCIRYSCNVVYLLFARCAHNERIMRLYPITHLFLFLSLPSPSCCSWVLGTYVKICCSNLCRFVSFQYELYFTTSSSLSSSVFLKNCSYYSRRCIQMNSGGMNRVEVAHVWPVILVSVVSNPRTVLLATGQQFFATVESILWWIISQHTSHRTSSIVCFNSVFNCHISETSTSLVY
jgi:hypothetical protein